MLAAREVVDRSVPRGLLRAAVEEHADVVVLGRRRGRTAAFRATLAVSPSGSPGALRVPWRASPSSGAPAVLNPGLEVSVKPRTAHLGSSGVGLEGDVVSEGFELGDEASGVAFGVAALEVVASGVSILPE
jgi:hypothetical protein